MNTRQKYIERYKKFIIRGGVEGWKDANDFADWLADKVKNFAHKDTVRVYRLDNTKPFSPLNCYVASSRQGVIERILHRRAVQRNIYEVEYLSGNKSFAVSIKIQEKAVNFYKAKIKTLEEAIKIRDKVLSQFLIDRSQVYGAHKITIFNEGDWTREPYRLMIGDYIVGWYSTPEEARKAVSREAPHAVDQIVLRQFTGYNDNMITLDELNGLLDELNRQKEVV